MRLALLQLNPTVGALDQNAARLIDAVRALPHEVDLAITPEMSLTGYPPRDLLLERSFVARSREWLDRIAGELASAPRVLVGLPVANDGEGRPLFNAAALIEDGRVRAFTHKTLLPTYDVFDEDRYFEPGGARTLLDVGTRRVAVSICEDIWNDRDFCARRRYHHDPVADARAQGADLLVNMSASPFAAGKQHLRERMLTGLAQKHGLPIAYVNQVGGNDDLVFDGRSLLVDANGRLLARAPGFTEASTVVDLVAAEAGVAPSDDLPEAEIFEALVLGTRDYVRKCGFSQVLLGLSGGIDSALVAAVAVEAVGPDRVLGVLMPSPYSSEGSVADAAALAAALGMRTRTIHIGDLMEAFDRALAPAFAGRAPDVTEENIQARIRGNLLMALSNKCAALLLTTGNKSELAVGYCTLYGDMSGGLAVIADVPKTMVYRIARWINARRPVIPESSLTKAPSAELRPDQTDQDSLPPYDVLDAMLFRHIEQHASFRDLVADGFDPDVVLRVMRLIRVAEFKRKQAAPGLKVTDRAFGSGWRMPIARGDW